MNRRLIGMDRETAGATGSRERVVLILRNESVYEGRLLLQEGRVEIGFVIILSSCPIKR